MHDEARYSVGDLLIDPIRGRVMRGQEEIPLPKLSYELLFFLTRNAPRLFSIDELIDKVWPGLVINPETVIQRVKLLRDALGDDPKSPRYIAGVRGRGYQMIAPVNLARPQEHWAASHVTSSPVAFGEPIRAANVATETSPSPSQPPLPSQPPSIATAPPVRAMPTEPHQGSTSTAWVAVALGALIFLGGAYFLNSQKDDPLPAHKREVVISADGAPAALPFKPPPHSVAVLAFANMSGDAKEEYFSDGLAEEMLNTLVRTNKLQVAARTSSFSFKGAQTDIPTIARKLNVGAVLEGSVRKVGGRVRISAQLIDALTGYHLWSQTFDRDLTDALEIQTDIAVAVASALRVALVGDEKDRLSDGGTDNPKAFDAYLRGIAQPTDTEATVRAAVADFAQAVALDPKYAFGRAGHGLALATLGNEWTGNDRTRRAQFAEARAEAERAVELAPRSGQVYAQLALVLGIVTTDFAAIDRALKKGFESEPGNVPLLKVYAEFSSELARPDALVAANRAIALDPLDSGAHGMRGGVLYRERRYQEASESLEHALQLKANARNRLWVGLNELAAGHTEAAAHDCETDRDLWFVQACLAIAYHRLGRVHDADEMLKRMKAAQGDYLASQYAEIYAQRGDSEMALRWLAKAFELHDPGLIEIMVDPFLDPIRRSLQFQDIVKKLKFPAASAP